MIKISKKLMEQINEHAQKDYPSECCGILLGKFKVDEKTVSEVIEIINEREDENKHNRYLIPSKKVLETELYAIKNGLDIVGFYHSHPNHSAVPSQFDVDYALPVYTYLIVSVYDAKVVDYTVSVLSNDRLKFEKEEIKGV
ncbi:M67 family metallopeptidase [Aliarcobacter butzleri]|uniref:Mov34/MPN/PAD-1 family protein n=1 Tax=Aliarcobacter butzleri TaxID=28197 RepID=UPI001EDC790C|nr:M67 family metallopeptidase [Aliarcobacter butzleri]MCG3652799.1 M67 family metallopeptidase [Aliarcobacter butzleri]MDN5101067.1 M67 family metallopeptidase [Aliarcobacter butzleri]